MYCSSLGVHGIFVCICMCEFICVKVCRQFEFSQGGPEEGVGFAGIEAIGSCKMPCGC